MKKDRNFDVSNTNDFESDSVINIQGKRYSMKKLSPDTLIIISQYEDIGTIIAVKSTMQ